MIELQVLSDREERLRKEILHCKIQREYLTQIASEIDSGFNDDSLTMESLIMIEQQSGDY